MILALKVSNKEQSVGKLQDILSSFNSQIKTRIGFNEGDCGIIILEIPNKNKTTGCSCGCSSEDSEIEQALKSLDNVKVKRICFKD